MKPNTQAFIWTILMWILIIFVGLFYVMAMSLDPFATYYTNRSIMKMILAVTSPYLIAWLIGLTGIYMIGYNKK